MMLSPMRLLVALSLLALASGRPEDLYDPRYDSFDVEQLVQNVRLLKAYSLCFLGEGNCTPDGKNFKKWLPDAVNSNCTKCSAKQRVMVAKVIKALMTNLPVEWEKLVKVYDPKKERADELTAYLNQYAP